MWSILCNRTAKVSQKPHNAIFRQRISCQKFFVSSFHVSTLSQGSGEVKGLFFLQESKNIPNTVSVLVLFSVRGNVGVFITQSTPRCVIIGCWVWAVITIMTLWPPLESNFEHFFCVHVSTLSQGSGKIKDYYEPKRERSLLKVFSL